MARRRFATLVALVALAACGGESAVAPAPEPFAVRVAPAADTLDGVGDTRQYLATVTDATGAPVSVLPQWSSSDPAILSIDASSGIGTAHAPGAVVVTARAGAVSGTTDVVVLPPAVIFITSASLKDTNINESTVTVRVWNVEGSGVFRLEFWQLPNSPGGANRLVATTEPIQVTRGYAETLAYKIPRLGVRWILAYTRPLTSATYHQTFRFDFP